MTMHSRQTRPLDVAPRMLFCALLLATAPVVAAGGFTPAKPKASRMETIALPPARTDSSFSVEHALQHRRSVRDFSRGALTLNEVAQLLWSAQGVTGPDGSRTAPSAGALYPLELTLVAGNVTGLNPGVYRYDPSRHALTPVSSGDRRGELALAALGQQWMEDAPALFAFGAVEERTTRKYGRRGIGYVYIEVGHAAQNAFLQAQALGLGAAVVGAFDDERVAAILDLPRTERAVYLMPVGKPSAP